jgi:hypothetical protein
VLLVLAGLYVPPLAALLGTDALAAGELAVVVLAAAVPAVVAQGLVLAGRRDTSPGTRSDGTFAPAARP